MPHSENFHHVPSAPKPRSVQAGPLGPALAAAVPGMTQLLEDPQAGIRRNAVSALGNLGPEGLGEELLQCQVPQRLLEMACGDPQPNVKEAALVALRSLRQEPCIHQVHPRGRVNHHDRAVFNIFSEFELKKVVKAKVPSPRVCN